MFAHTLVNAGMQSAIGELEVVGTDGKLYTSMDEPFPHVNRYRVEIREP